MAKGNKPWGRAVAAIDYKDNEGAKTRWVTVGPVWQNRDGSLSVDIEATPVAWLKPALSRRLVIWKNEAAGAEGDDPDVQYGDDPDDDGAF